ncbi:MAG: hypothetical protein IPK63_08435 [Candidatus Competibacteraceae bacterium]|nr:hypothetical protein [Candidatus Competibacteraceae bacterium]
MSTEQHARGCTPSWQFGNWEADDKQKTAALKGMIRLAPDCQKQLKALRERQAALAEQYGEMVLALEVTHVAFVHFRPAPG